MEKTKEYQNLKSSGVFEVVWRFIKTNYLMCMFIFAVVIIELTGVCVTSGRFYISVPWLYLTVVFVFAFISLLLPGHKSRYFYFLSVLVGIFVFDLIFIIIYETTGTIFDYAMLNLRSDAMLIVESLPFNFAYVFVSALMISCFGAFGWILRKYVPDPQTRTVRRVTASILLVIMFGAHACLAYFPNAGYTESLRDKLYAADDSNYAYAGITGNFFNQIYQGSLYMNKAEDNYDELTEFVYKTTTEETAFTGIADSYNVITMLGESFEWFTFLNSKEYPNGLKADTATLKKVFPNLYRMYGDDSTVILNNSHAREKTDISENKALIGNYPMYKFINYDYPDNEMPFTLPNLMKSLYGVESNAFHDGFSSFYNRDAYFTSGMGFNSFTSCEEMDDIVLDEYGLGERNLDTQMISSCVEQMFPTDRRFMTQITTITQHGQYAERKNLVEYYDILDAYGVAPYSETDDNANNLRYYAAAGMELDRAVGMILDYLEEHDLADKTIFVLFGDHNAYYQGLTNYVKGIYDASYDNYTELYRTPVMIKVGNYAFEESERVINKFTDVCDIYATVIDLLGIKTYANLNYGVSAFSSEESVLYSRAFGKFMNEHLYFTSFADINFKSSFVTDEYLDQIKTKVSGFAEKIDYVNRIYSSDYFAYEKANFDAADTYAERVKALNGIE